MKKVFMIAHQFPPVGGSGVQRTSKFVKYLPELGYEPIIFTIKAEGGKGDHTLQKDIAPGTTVIRTKAYDVESGKGIFELLGKVIGRKILIPDAQWLWYLFGRKKALEYVRDNHIDLIYTTSSPYSGHLMGHYIKKKLKNVQWVADFRDEWTNNPYIQDKHYPALRSKIERKMEEKVAYGCDYFIANTPLMLKSFLGDYDIAHKSFVIPNGYDHDDFQGLDRSPRKNEKFTITYSGSIYGRTKPDAFFEALKQAVDEKSIDPDKVSVKIIGNFTAKLVERMREIFPYDKILEFSPYVPHRESIKKLLESDILLFIIGIGKGADRIYTGKIFEYFYANRPMLAMVPENSVAGDIIEETHTGYLCSNEDPQDIYRVLMQMYGEWEQGISMGQPDWEKIKQYDRRELTNKLVSVFNQALSKQKG